MFKQQITYTDFNGEERTEDFYFHLSTPEVTRLEAKAGKPLSEVAKELSESNDTEGLIQFFEEVVLMAYGIKSADGKTFKKGKEVKESFEYSQAYAEFFEMLLTDPELAKKFGEGVVAGSKKKATNVAEIN